jgi:hypothetical protein
MGFQTFQLPPKTFSKLLVVLLFGATHVGCRKSPLVDSANWSKPEVVSHSRDSLISSFSLYKWNNTLLAVNHDAGPLSVYFLQEDGETWRTKGSQDDWLPLNVEPSGTRFVASKGSRFEDNLTVNFFTGLISPNGDYEVTAKNTWKTDKAAFFGKTGTNVSFESWNKNGPVPQPFLGGIFNGPAIHIPYCIRGDTIRDGGLMLADGPFDNGVFFSLDSGKTWQRERIDSTDSVSPYVSRTKRFYYFTAGRTYDHELWFSRKSVDGGAWSSPAIVTKQYAEWNSAVAEGETVHVCWLDRRHEKKRLNAFNPFRENYEVAYSHRKDSDSEWSKDVILSKGLLYAYEPVMSVEGEKVVVAWSGIHHDKDGHGRNWPNDIYYATSKDGGNTWAKPMNVTDGFKDGLTAGNAQVALLNGVIYLFYIQGKYNYKEASAGMALLNQPPWPIYYQQRPFPN